ARPPRGLLGVHPVLAVQPAQGFDLRPPLALAWLAHRAGDRVAAAQPVLAHLGQRHIHVVRPGQVAGSPDERVVVQDVQDAGDRDEDVVLGDDRLGVAAVPLTPAAAAAGPQPAAPPAPPPARALRVPLAPRPPAP